MKAWVIAVVSISAVLIAAAAFVLLKNNKVSSR